MRLRTHLPASPFLTLALNQSRSPETLPDLERPSIQSNASSSLIGMLTTPAAYSLFSIAVIRSSG